MKYSVIIPTRISLKTLTDCLLRLSVTLPDNDSEIIVVGNGLEEERTRIKGQIQGLQSSIKNLRYYESYENGFAPACNKGAQQAKGDTLIFLNDDAFPSIRWLELYETTRTMLANNHPYLKVGCIGPMSNFAISTQLVDQHNFPQCNDINQIDTVQERIIYELVESQKNIVQPAANLSGFCLFVKRSLFNEAGMFQSFGGLGGYEDNDLCVRLSLKGYTHFIAKSIFVFHHGSTTLNVLAPETLSGTTHNIRYLVKTKPKDTPKTLCISYRVKIDTERDGDIFVASLNKSAELADTIVVYDDRSSIDLHALKDKTSEQAQSKIKITKKDSTEFNETQDRQTLLDLARAEGTDWIFNLDHDEIITQETTRAVIDKLMNPIDPRIAAYSIPIRTYWRSTDKIRVDGIWGQMRLQTFFKSDPRLGNIFATGDSKFHCTRGPSMIPHESVLRTNAIAVEHYGYHDYESQAVKKFKYYEENDDVKNPKLIGASNYNHLVDEKSLSLVPYVRPKVYLAVMCRNESRRLSHLLSRYNTFFNGIIVQDNGSTDETLEFLKTFNIPYLEYRCCDKYKDPDHMTCDFAAARNNVIEYLKNTEAEYVIFLDPDEEIDLATEITFDHLFYYDLADAYGCTIVNYRENKLSPSGMEKSKQPGFRMFRVCDDIYYSRTTHETIEKSIHAKEGISICFDTNDIFIIRHYGYLETSPEARQERNKKYAERLEKLFEEDPEDAVVSLALGVHYRENGDYERSHNFIHLALSSKPTYWLARNELIHSYMRKAIMLLSDIPEGGAPPLGSPEAQAAGEIAKSLLQWFPDLASRARLNV